MEFFSQLFASAIGGAIAGYLVLVGVNLQFRRQSEAALRQLVMTDGHPPGEYRADTVRNIDAWYSTFEVKPGEKLYLAPEERVRIW